MVQQTSSDLGFRCLECREIFTLKGALHVHLRTRHGWMKCPSGFSDCATPPQIDWDPQQRAHMEKCYFPNPCNQFGYENLMSSSRCRICRCQLNSGQHAYDHFQALHPCTKCERYDLIYCTYKSDHYDSCHSKDELAAQKALLDEPRTTGTRTIESHWEYSRTTGTRTETLRREYSRTTRTRTEESRREDSRTARTRTEEWASGTARTRPEESRREDSRTARTQTEQSRRDEPRTSKPRTEKSRREDPNMSRYQSQQSRFEEPRTSKPQTEKTRREDPNTSRYQSQQSRFEEPRTTKPQTEKTRREDPNTSRYQNQESRREDPRTSRRQSTKPKPSTTVKPSRPEAPIDVYAILGVSPDCSHEEAKKAARKCRIDAHPDKLKRVSMTTTTGNKIDDAAKLIGMAADIVLDPARRREHDEEMREWRRKYGGHSKR